MNNNSVNIEREEESLNITTMREEESLNITNINLLVRFNKT